MKHNKDLADLVACLKKDPKGEGGLQAFDSGVLAEALRARLIVVVPCSRDGFNIRLTRLGRKYA